MRRFKFGRASQRFRKAHRVRNKRSALTEIQMHRIVSLRGSVCAIVPSYKRQKYLKEFKNG